MKIGVDYWGTITKYPDLFRELLSAFSIAGHEVIILTAAGMNTSKKSYTERVKTFLEKEAIPYDEVVVVQFDDWITVPEIKVEKAQELGVKLFIDDRQDVCDLMQRRGVPALWVASGKKIPSTKLFNFDTGEGGEMDYVESKPN